MKLFLIILSVFLFQSCQAQTEKGKQSAKKEKQAGGPCEGCEAIYETPISFNQLNWIDTIPGYGSGPKLEINGTVYHKDGKTPAPNVVVYIYHTNTEGIYQQKGNETGWGKRHGYMRGWIRTNEKGQYRFYTTRPGSYPNSNNPQHIHATIKEEGYSEYYIDDYFFDDDPLLKETVIKNNRHRGGNGVMKLKNINGTWQIHRDIILGKNIPGYD